MVCIERMENCTCVSRTHVSLYGPFLINGDKMNTDFVLNFKMKFAVYDMECSRYFDGNSHGIGLTHMKLVCPLVCMVRRAPGRNSSYHIPCIMRQSSSNSNLVFIMSLLYYNTLSSHRRIHNTDYNGGSAAARILLKQCALCQALL